MAVLITFSLVTVAQSRVLERERDTAEEERDRAEQVTGLLVGLFESADPAHTLGDTVPVGAFLEQGLARASLDLAGQPRLLADIFDVIAQAFHSLGSLDRAALLYDSALVNLHAAGGETRRDRSRVLFRAGELARQRGDIAASERFFREHLRHVQALEGDTGVAVLDGLRKLREALHARSKRGEADSVQAIWESRARAHESSTDARMIHTLVNLASRRPNASCSTDIARSPPPAVRTTVTSGAPPTCSSDSIPNGVGPRTPLRTFSTRIPRRCPTLVDDPEVSIATTAPCGYRHVLTLDQAAPVASLTAWLHRLRDDDPQALPRLLPLVYNELRVLAHAQLRHERTGHTLGTTALVHEAYLRLAKREKFHPEDRRHFFAIAAQSMRRVLIDYARSRKRKKRGEDPDFIPIDDVAPFLSDQAAGELLALDDALDRLARANPRAASVVEQRYFAGLTLEETASVLGVSLKTVQRDWIVAQAWLRKEIRLQLTTDTAVPPPFDARRS